MLDTLPEVALVGANAALYALLAYQVRPGRRRPFAVEGAAEAFSVLEKELKRAMPSLQRGFTWKEAVEQARRLGLEADWPRVGREVDAYQAYRYGGEQEPAEYGGVLVLARSLRGSR